MLLLRLSRHLTTLRGVGRLALLPLLLASSARAQQVAPAAGRPRVVSPPPESHGLEFVENKGQWDARARYGAALPGGRLFLEKDAFTYNFVAGVPRHRKGSAAARGVGNDGPFRAHAVRVQFEGASAGVQLHAELPTSGVYNFLTGADPARWGRGAHGFGAVRYAGLWPGIAMRVYENATQRLEYDFELAAGANPARLRLRYEGASRVQLDPADGSLRVETSAGTFRELAPVAFQLDAAGQRQPVACAYELSGASLRFRLGAYDARRPLTIDPTVEFSSFTGATSDNWGFTATYDQQGNLYSGGIAFDTGYPTSPGAYDASFAGTIDMAFIKYHPAVSGPAARVWATYVGGQEAEFPHSIVTNARGELVIMGTTSSLDYPTTAGAHDRSFNGGREFDPYGSGRPYTMRNGTDLVVSRLSANGDALLASTYLGGSANDGVLDYESPAPKLVHNYGDYFRGDVLLDATGNVYLATSTASPNFPTPTGFAKAYRGGVTDAVVCQLGPDLRALRWSNLLGGGAADAAYSLQLDKAGNLYVAGGTASPNFPTTPGALQAQAGGDVDAFVARISAGGDALQKSTYLGTRAYDQAYFLQLDLAGEVYLLGQTQGEVAISAGRYGMARSGQYVQKLSKDLDALRFSTVFGTGRGQIDLSPTAFLVDQCDRVYISGWGGSINGARFGFANGTTAGLPVTGNALQKTTDSDDFYLAQFSPGMAQLEYATFLGNNDSSEGDHVDGGTSRFDPQGIVYHAVCACGQSGSGFPVPPGANTYRRQNGFSNCNNAAFKMRFETLFLTTTADTLACAGGPPVRLLGAPAGGTWAGTGVSGSAAAGFVFTPTVGLIGSHTLTYTVPGVGACGGAVSVRVRVAAVPTASIAAPAQTTFCPTSTPITLTGSPAGGTFSGPGVRNGTTFDPAAAGAGTHQLTYTYQFPAGASLRCPATATLALTVLPAVSVKLPPDTVLCPGSAQAFRLRATPAGGTWTGAGVSGSATAGYRFTPPADLAGRQVTLTYTPLAQSCAAPAAYRISGVGTPLLSAFWAPVLCPENTVAPLRLRFSIASSFSDNQAGTVSWDFGDGTPAVTGAQLDNIEHSYTQPGTYQPKVTLTYFGGRCQSQATAPPVTVRAPFFPNIITPGNADKLNATFAPVMPCAMHLRVFSRWGKQVYESAAYANDWTGDGLPGGVYYYLFDDSSGQKIKGWLEIVR